MNLDLSDWSDRLCYYLGRYYELDTQLLLEAAVKEGDVFIDVGANVGMIALCAARLVGRSGKVIAFEPNAKAAAACEEHVRVNGLEDRVLLHRCGLSDRSGEAVLRVFDDHTGSGTMAECPPADVNHVTDSPMVAVRRGDEVLPLAMTAPVFVKIDVEGFEPRVIAGMERFIGAVRPGLLMEANAGLLARANHSFRELAVPLSRQGYEGFEVGCARHRLRWRLELKRLGSDALPVSNNVLWLVPGTTYAERLRRWIEA